MASLSPYNYRPVTPPSASDPPGLVHDSKHSRHASGSSIWSRNSSRNSSPDSLDVQIETPSRSPIRQHGPALLPKLRTQDQGFLTTESIPLHKKSASTSGTRLPARRPTRPAVQRSTTSPPDFAPIVSPTSATTTQFNFNEPALDSPITVSASHSRNSSLHSRSVSTSGVDEATLARYGYPTYRQPPTYITGAQYRNSVIPGSSTFICPPPISRPQPQYHSLPPELQYDSPFDRTITPREYLTAPNPPVNLVHHVKIDGTGEHSHFWWDIRNVRTWDDFNLSTIESIPGFNQLLKCPIRAAALTTPTIASSRLQPESEAALQSICYDFYAAKVNAALRTSMGHANHITMRAERAKDRPHFLSNYQNDIEKTIAGNGRGRVVGIVKSFDRWNTGMRHESAKRKVEYLQTLAHLHRYMREHACRYGFIMTEIELVCVRAGTDATPYFGFLELAPTVEMKTQGPESLTACLALWYLHMLAKEEPLPGQCGWRLEVGAPAAMTRMHILEEKDEWIPEAGVSEKRRAKTNRGWVMPGDPWNKRKEMGRSWHR